MSFGGRDIHERQSTNICHIKEYKSIIFWEGLGIHLRLRTNSRYVKRSNYSTYVASDQKRHIRTISIYQTDVHT